MNGAEPHRLVERRHDADEAVAADQHQFGHGRSRGGTDVGLRFRPYARAASKIGILALSAALYIGRLAFKKRIAPAFAHGVRNVEPTLDPG